MKRGFRAPREAFRRASLQKLPRAEAANDAVARAARAPAARRAANRFISRLATDRANARHQRG